ncbi:RmlD substrate binding domain protein [mine drainage metagenome]|uniref:RmlD substrate binding domain protein n=1 Tax=mine drainage metagenome TaxID=410659 RepID=A0A1J5R9S9_9ZZZZ
MTQVLIVGCGDLGSAVANQLVQLGIKTIGVRRSVDSHSNFKIIQADVTQPSSLNILREVQPEILIYCVAANGQTDTQYKAHYVDGLQNVLATQDENTQLKHVFFVSSTRVYGQVTDVLLTESVDAIPADFGGERLLEGEHLLDSINCNSTVLRLSGIYGEGRLRMINLAETPDKWPVQNNWSNRIHRDDAAAFIVFLTQQVLAVKEIKNCYIVTDSMPVPQHEVLRWLVSQLPIKVQPENISHEALPIEGGKRLSNEEMLSTGFKLQYPDFKAGYQAILSQCL